MMDNDPYDPDARLTALEDLVRMMALDLTALSLVMRASHSVLGGLVLADMHSRELGFEGHPDLLSGYKATVTAKCDAALSALSDTNPSLASAVKRLIDDIHLS